MLAKDRVADLGVLKVEEGNDECSEEQDFECADAEGGEAVGLMDDWFVVTISMEIFKARVLLLDFDAEESAQQCGEV